MTYVENYVEYFSSVKLIWLERYTILKKLLRGAIFRIFALWSATPWGNGPQGTKNIEIRTTSVFPCFYPGYFYWACPNRDFLTLSGPTWNLAVYCQVSLIFICPNFQPSLLYRIKFNLISISLRGSKKWHKTANFQNAKFTCKPRFYLGGGYISSVNISIEFANNRWLNIFGLFLYENDKKSMKYFWKLL